MKWNDIPVSDFLSRIKVGKYDLHDIIPIHLICKTCYMTYYFCTRSGAKKEIIVGKVYEKPFLSHMIPEKVPEITGSTHMNQPQLDASISSVEDWKEQV